MAPGRHRVRCDNRVMTRRNGCSGLLFAVAITAALGGCTKRSGAIDSDQLKADEAAIRRTLAETEERINKGDLGFVNVFAKDAVIIVPSAPDIVGFEAIRAVYADLLKHASMTVHFSTQEVAVAGDLAYERGTYTIRISEKASGRLLQDAKNKHVHILKRQPDGSWKTWRLMVSSAEGAGAGK